jgi:hypothetical protein
MRVTPGQLPALSHRVDGLTGCAQKGGSFVGSKKDEAVEVRGACDGHGDSERCTVDPVSVGHASLFARA